MYSQKSIGLALVVLLSSSLIATTYAAAVEGEQQLQDQARKFVAKPNDIKKQQQIQNIKPNTKQEAASGFDWNNAMNVAMKLFFGGPVGAGGQGASDKMDIFTKITSGDFTWSELVSVGLKVVLGFFNGDINAMEKSDVGSPLEGILAAMVSYMTGSSDPKEISVMARQATELVGLVMSLMDALRVSFTQRSISARSLGTSDHMADAAIAVTTIGKCYLKSYDEEDDLCIQKCMCETNHDCVDATGESGYLFCQILTYGMSYVLEHTTYTPFEILNDAGRMGRVNGTSCVQIFNECNEV